jgi:hypothetical protein
MARAPDLSLVSLDCGVADSGHERNRLITTVSFWSPVTLLQDPPRVHEKQLGDALFETGNPQSAQLKDMLARLQPL